MAQLDQMATRIKSPPVTDDINVLRSYVKDLANIVAMLSKNLEYIVNGNIDGTSNIRVNSIISKNIQAGAIVADKIDVDKLSAISADMGTIEAGEIYGALIATEHAGVYPRIEFTSTANLLAAYYNALNMINFLPILAGAPAIEFVSNGVRAGTVYSASDDTMQIASVQDDLVLTAWNNLILLSGFGNVVVDSWNKLYSTNNGQTLQQALDALSARITALGG